MVHLWEMSETEVGVPVPLEREKVRFVSTDTECVAWYYPGSSDACVVMAGGFAVTKEPGTDLFARRFHKSGFSVLAFDYRHIGESGGRPRQVLPIRDQLADWEAAVSFASSLPGVDATKIAAWGFSASGGHVVKVAARIPGLAAAIAQNPTADGLASARSAARHQKPIALMRLTGRGLLDAVRSLAGLRPILVPLAGKPGSVAVLTTPDALDGNRALNPDNRYPDWQQEVAARSALRLGIYRPGRDASRVRCPLLVLVCDGDETALASPAVRAVKRATKGELARLPGGHYEPFLGGHERAVAIELSFLRRHLLDVSPSEEFGSISATREDDPQ